MARVGRLVGRASTVARGGASQAAAVAGALLRARAEGRRHRPRPPAHGRVLEVGAGQAPHPRADVVVDKFPFDDYERPGQAGFSFARPVIVADGERLPFASDAFAYAMAVHVLEHAEDPQRFAAELSRVAPAGFVQVPSRQSELVFGWPYHAWLIDREHDELVFEPRGERVAHFGEYFHRSYADSPLLRLWWAAERSRWHHSLEWSGALRVRVLGDSRAEHAHVDVERTVAWLTALSAEGVVAPLPDDLAALLRCPLCAGPLVRGAGEIRCGGEGHAFPLAGHAPVLLAEAAR